SGHSFYERQRVVRRPKGQIIQQASAIKPPRNQTGCKQCAYFRRKEKILANRAVIQRLDAHGIARHEQALLARIPNSKCIHAAKMVQTVFAPAAVRLEHNFGIGPAAEANALAFKLLADLAEVVDLAVMDDPITGLGVLHRLVAQRREVEYGETPVSEADFRRAADDYYARIIRATMRERSGCALEYLGRDSPTLHRDANDSTHERSSNIPSFIAVFCTSPDTAHQEGHVTGMAPESAWGAGGRERKTGSQSEESRSHWRVTISSPLPAKPGPPPYQSCTGPSHSESLGSRRCSPKMRTARPVEGCGICKRLPQPFLTARCGGKRRYSTPNPSQRWACNRRMTGTCTPRPRSALARVQGNAVRRPPRSQIEAGAYCEERRMCRPSHSRSQPRCEAQNAASAGKQPASSPGNERSSPWTPPRPKALCPAQCRTDPQPNRTRDRSSAPQSQNTEKQTREDGLNADRQQ